MQIRGKLNLHLILSATLSVHVGVASLRKTSSRPADQTQQECVRRVGLASIAVDRSKFVSARQSSECPSLSCRSTAAGRAGRSPSRAARSPPGRVSRCWSLMGLGISSALPCSYLLRKRDRVGVEENVVTNSVSQGSFQAPCSTGATAS